MSLTRRSALGLMAGAALAPSLVRAEGFPEKVVTIVVPYPAGGPTDAIARFVAQDLSVAFGHNVLVDNRAGASGAVGTRAVAHGAADGYTIVFGNNQTHGNNMFLLKDPGYDAVKDFAPLAGVGAFEHAFVVRNDLQAKTIPELIALAKAEPGKLNYGSTGVGSGSHLAMELFMQRTGIKMTHVPFRGAAPLVQEIVAGRIDIAVSTLPSVLEQINAGALRALAIASPERNPQAKAIPTLREQGVSNADADSWAAFFAPAKTPQPALHVLSKAIIASLNKPATRDAIIKLGFTLKVRDPEAFRPYHAKEIETWKQIIAEAGVQPA
ncbi:MAG: Bug family tripartite tricarboxylate transporter substrate binding protein [Bosea sp. (in: a-proteobacteria)]|uniref:Bug family tripartite tricarboxylate transporter substrate binding protein n=1 Tax=Bosea sp. (in: a-proteobacteria) TaxID=1871050 RepID=UPI001AC4FFA8|nr:tripartite tricarboxylate transporter substrate binding protein [Bosea sp. (in: a-proteobacteria)]MBN9441499.1 tripartite tricarboxylate transporter substrate binding protein [Bosea sp. (in: a-proteobacteria)]